VIHPQKQEQLENFKCFLFEIEEIKEPWNWDDSIKSKSWNMARWVSL